MENKRPTTDFAILSERISAQTQAYVEFSNALVKIIENTASIRDNTHDINVRLIDDYKTLNSKLQELNLEVNRSFAENKNSQQTLIRDVSDLNEQVETIINLMNENNVKLFSMIEELTSSVQGNGEIARSNFDLNTKNFNTLKEVSEKTDGRITNLVKTWDKVKIYVAAIVSIITIVGILMGFGIIDISWFVK